MVHRWIGFFTRSQERTLGDGSVCWSLENKDPVRSILSKASEIDIQKGILAPEFFNPLGRFPCFLLPSSLRRNRLEQRKASSRDGQTDEEPRSAVKKRAVSDGSSVFLAGFIMIFCKALWLQCRTVWITCWLPSFVIDALLDCGFSSYMVHDVHGFYLFCSEFSFFGFEGWSLASSTCLVPFGASGSSEQKGGGTTRALAYLDGLIGCWWILIVFSLSVKKRLDLPESTWGSLIEPLSFWKTSGVTKEAQCHHVLGPQTLHVANCRIHGPFC